MFSGFRSFLLRGNVVDLAIAVVIGAAFGSVVTALVTDLITPIIAAIGGQPNFSQLTFTINNSEFFYGAFISAVVAFVIIAAAIYFVVVVPYNQFMARYKPSAPPPPTRECPVCTSAIAIAATRCPSEISPAAAGQ